MTMELKRMAVQTYGPMRRIMAGVHLAKHNVSMSEALIHWVGRYKCYICGVRAGSFGVFLTAISFLVSRIAYINR